MKTRNLLITDLLLVAALLGSCTSMEEPVGDESSEPIQINAGIAEATRAVINSGYTSDLNVSFARMDNPGAANSPWQNPSIHAVRSGGAGNTSITFESEQNYLTEEGETALIGYYPRKALDSGTGNPVSVSYTLTGDEDIMATEVQRGSLVKKFETFTFKHLLTQLQFKCTGSTGAIAKWTGITSIKVKDTYTTVKLSLDKTDGATLVATGIANQTLSVIDCPSAVSTSDAPSPAAGYLLFFPVANMGTEAAPLYLEVKGTYDRSTKTLDVPITNIDGGVKAGYSHLITLTFAEDGTITAEAGIAEWVSGNGGSGVVTPGT